MVLIENRLLRVFAVVAIVGLGCNSLPTDPENGVTPDSEDVSVPTDNGSLELYTNFTKSVGFCFNKNDLSALQKLINNNATDNTINHFFSLTYWGLDYNHDGILDPLEFGIQEWINGRLSLENY